MERTLTEPQIDALVEALDREGRAEIGRVLDVDSRLLASRVVIEVLGAFGVQARPMPVWATVLTAAYTRLLAQEGRAPVGQAAVARWRAARALRIEIGHPNDADTGDGAWPGHLVALIGERIAFDLALGQANVPTSGLSLTSAFVAVPPEWIAGTQQVEGELGDAVVRYTARPDVTSYTDHPHWTQPLPPVLRVRLVRKLRLLTGIDPLPQAG